MGPSARLMPHSSSATQLPPEVESIAYAVCTTGIEWIWTREADVWLTETVPRVCVLDELLDLLDPHRLPGTDLRPHAAGDPVAGRALGQSRLGHPDHGHGSQIATCRSRRSWRCAQDSGVAAAGYDTGAGRDMLPRPAVAGQ